MLFCLNFYVDIFVNRILGISLCLLFLGTASFPQFPFSSSQTNRDIADREYGNSPMERYVAKSFGDEIPFMRDDLIRRKNNGEGFWSRHWNAWKTGNNWKVNWLNDFLENWWHGNGRKLDSIYLYHHLQEIYYTLHYHWVSVPNKNYHTNIPNS